MKTLKITVDTNILIYLFDPKAEEVNVEKSCSLLKKILEIQKYISVDVQISTSLEDDLFQDENCTRRKYLLSRIRQIFQQISSGEFITKNNEVQPKYSGDSALFQELRKVLFPNLDSSSASYVNNINDLKHIFSHIKNQRDIYVTNDENFLKESKKNALAALNVYVMSSGDLIKHLESYSSKDTYEHKAAPVRHDYRNIGLSGVGKMDFTNNNGLYIIGNGDFIFEIKWGECSHEKMRVYNDPSTIEAIALAEDKKFKEVISDRFYDFTDRCREPRRKKDILILKNSKGNFAAIKIIDFKVKDRGDDMNYLEFEYIINTSGKCDFKNLTPDPNILI